jgi:hypothetical protein
MSHDLTKGQKRALREAAALAHQRDVATPVQDRDVHFLEARNADLPLIVGAAVADGLLTEAEVPEAARELVRDMATRIRSMREGYAGRPVVEASDPYVPEALVSLAAILELVDMFSDLSCIYVNRMTGEAIILHEEELSMLEGEFVEDIPTEDEDGRPLPQWQQESMRRLQEIRENDDWLQVATRQDVDEYSIMKRFAGRARPSVSKVLLDALHGKGAYRRFRDAVHRTGSQAEWEEFRSESIARQMRSVLDAEGVQYRR